MAAATGSARRRRGLIAVPVALLVALSATGCGNGFVNRVSSIGAEGTGEGAYSITAIIPSAAGLVTNAPVMINDTIVGSVGNIRIEDWRARLTLRLNRGTEVPVGSHAMIGMTSVLGSSHLALVPPEDPPAGQYLTAGAEIPLADCPEPIELGYGPGEPIPSVTAPQQLDPCRYPTTEQVLSSLSVVLNGGGLSQIGQITSELNNVFTGAPGPDGQRSPRALADLVPQLAILVDELADQTDEIIAAMDSLNRLTEGINAQTPTLERALSDGPEILQLLVNQRQNLVDALDNVGELSATANKVLRKSTDDIEVIVPNVRKLLDQLRTTGPALTNSMRIMFTFPFLEENIPLIIKGDYVNSDLVLDLTFSRLSSSMIASLGLTGPEGVLGHTAGAARGGSNPFELPFDPGALIPGPSTDPANPSAPNPSAPRPSAPNPSAPNRGER